jgi:hypothetical protein
MFTKLQKSILVSSSLSPYGTTRLPHWTDIHEIWYLRIFEKGPENSSFIKIWQEWRVLYMTTNIHFLSYLVQFFLEWNMFQTNAVEKMETYILCSVTFFRKSCLYEIMWKKFAERGGPQMIIWRMRIACWIPKATNTHSQYVILITFPPQQRLHERASMWRYTHIACVVSIRSEILNTTVTFPYTLDLTN